VTKPQPQADPRDRIGVKTALAELVFPRGPEPKHHRKDEDRDNYPDVSETVFTCFLFFTLKFSISERERRKKRCFRERTSARSKLSSTHAWFHGEN